MTSSSMALSTASGFGFVGPASTGKFFPVLYGVAPGTYNAVNDNNYGVDQPVQPALDIGTGLPVQYSALEANSAVIIGQRTVQASTVCNWTRQENVVNFDLGITLRGSQADPFPTGNFPAWELKIHAQPVAFGSPQQYNLRGLPLPDPAQDSPVFDVEFVNSPFVNALTGPRSRYLPAGTTLFRGRLLKDGTIALITVSGAALQTDTPFPSNGTTSLYTTILLAALSNGGCATLRMRGTYFTGNNY